MQNLSSSKPAVGEIDGLYCHFSPSPGTLEEVQIPSNPWGYVDAVILEQGARPSLVRSSMKPPAKVLRICCHYGMTTAADAVETVEAHCC